MYDVIEYFEDLKDGNAPYEVGSKYPAPGVKVNKERLAELAGENNRRGRPVIKLVEKKKAAKAAKDEDITE